MSCQSKRELLVGQKASDNGWSAPCHMSASYALSEVHDMKHDMTLELIMSIQQAVFLTLCLFNGCQGAYINLWQWYGVADR